MNSVQTLIARASAKCHSDSELAKSLGVSKQLLSAMKNGERTVTPEIAAQLADLVGEDARQAVVDAVIERAAGTPRGAALREILGKGLAAGVAGAWAISYAPMWTGAMEKIVNSLYIV